MNENQFLKLVAEHQMLVIQNDGAYRHLRFKKPSGLEYYFDLVTWTGHLCFTGDMGTYVFSRVSDMFTFFRGQPPDGDNKVLGINPSYWGQKVLAEDRVDKVKAYTTRRAQEVLEQRLKESRLSAKDQEEVRSMLCGAMDDEDSFRREVMDLPDPWARAFTDFWEEDLREYTTRFLFCCYAVVWGVAQYDTFSKARGRREDT